MPLRLYCTDCGATRTLTVLVDTPLCSVCRSERLSTWRIRILKRWVTSANDRRFLRSLRIASGETEDDGA